MTPRRRSFGVLLSYFSPQSVSPLVDAVAASELHRRAPVFIGSYGTSERTNEIVTSVTGVGYAPMFPIKQGVFWRRRRVTAAQRAALPDDGLAGPLPSWRALARGPARERVRWGRELGRRFRDSMRRAGVAGHWQLDEIPSAAARSRAHRDFTGGVLRGLRFGRIELGDAARKGFVWTPRVALGLASAPVDAELQRFWMTLDEATFRLVGEEYPPFVGDPRRAARSLAAGQRALAAGGPIRRSLGRRYVAGATPGHYLGRGLGGNVARRPRREVIAWRQAYLDERVRAGVRGLAEYNFRFANSAPRVMRDVVTALARAVE